ncbi:hypothetical protein OSB04_024432 [Centaurea solstitialis]|uniref:Uncharacterized protein n=1 Tax=Centaurea solstitialis TaxID=347529 RepID=A0AA38SL37_9ASTR|nr:hypothetical protein OSB04_024432 [Centaurea solstitialis]
MILFRLEVAAIVDTFNIKLSDQVELAHGGPDRYSNHGIGRGGGGGDVSRRSEYRGVYIILFLHVVRTNYQEFNSQI